MTGSKKLSSRPDDFPVTKISLPTTSSRRSFLPMVITTIVLVGTFFVGHQIGGLFWPEAPSLGQTLTVVGKKSLALTEVASKKVSQSIKDTKKTTVSLTDSGQPTIYMPEPSLNQSWRELVASASVGGSKFSLFGKQLWDTLANKTAGTVDWLAYGAVKPQEKMVEVVNGAKLSLRDNIGGSLNTVSVRVASSSIQIKESALVMGSQVQNLDDLDQKTTSYLSDLVSGLGRTALNFGQQTKTGLIFVSSKSRDLPAEMMVGVNELFWQPLAEKTNNLTDGTLSVVNLTGVGSEILSEKSYQSFSYLTTAVSNFVNNTKGGYQYVASYSGQTNSQVAAVKFLGLADSTREFFAMLWDRTKAVWHWLVNFFSNLWQTAANNWKTFFGLSIKPVVTPTQSQIDSTLLSELQEKIKNDLRGDLRQEIADIVRSTSANNLSDKTSGGLIVVSSTGSKEGDDKMKAEIQKMFSDRVTVSLDANRKAGVITPVFDPSENYIFLLAPVKK